MCAPPPPPPAAQQPDLDTECLVQALAAGDPAAWAWVVARYRRLLHHVTLRTGLGREQREDVLQTTWLRLFEHAAQLRTPEAIGSWLVTTAVREALAVRRRSRHEQVTQTLPESAADGEDLDDLMHLHLAADALRSAVTRLPQRERLVLQELMAPEQPSYAEIAVRLRMPIGAVGPVRQRALRRLEPALATCWRG